MQLKVVLTTGLVALACLAATAAAGTSSNSANFADPAGDSGNAPDVTAVNVSNDDSGNITFRITIANRSDLGPQDVLVLGMDTDGNLSDGVNGVDYAALVVGPLAVLASGSGGSLHPALAASFSGTFAGGVETISVNRADIGNPSQINLFVAASGDGGTTIGENAPDSGVWNYPVVGSQTTTTTTTTTTSTSTSTASLTLSAGSVSTTKAKAGKPFAASMRVTRSDGAALAGKVTCKASVGGKPLAGHGQVQSNLVRCVWQVPKGARGKRLSGSLAVASGGVSVSKPFSVRVG